MFVGREVHDVFVVGNPIDLRCPEPFLFGSVFLVECKSCIHPRAQVVGCVASYAVGIVRAVGIVLAVVNQNVWVGKWNLALASLCQGD